MRTEGIKRILGEGFGILHLQANGDCFYEAIVKGLAEGATCIKSLRSLVADALTEDIWLVYKSIGIATPGYEWTTHCESLLEAKKRISKNADESASASAVVWADVNAMETVAAALPCVILIYDEEGRYSSSKFVKIGVDVHQQDAEDKHVIMLCRSRREHFSLITFKSESGDAAAALLLRDLPLHVRRLFGVIAVPTLSPSSSSSSSSFSSSSSSPSFLSSASSNKKKNKSTTEVAKVKTKKAKKF